MSYKNCASIFCGFLIMLLCSFYGKVNHMDNPMYGQIQQPDREAGDLAENEPEYDEIGQGAHNNGDTPP